LERQVIAVPAVILRTEQQFAQIGIRSSHARMQISMPQGQMRIQNTKPQIEVDTQIPRFRVPRERLRNELNLGGPLSFAREFRDKGKQAALRAIGTYASEGDFITNTGIPGDKSIPMMVSNKMKNYFRKPETNIGLMPSSPPSLDWDKGHIRVNASRHNISVDWSGDTTANITVDTGYPVEVSLSRQPSFRVTGIEPAVQNRTMGRFVDRMV